jgi:hypothetical protein
MEYPQIHPRERIVRAAETELLEAVIEWRMSHRDLTFGEELRIVNKVLSETIAGMAKHEIRAERHPDNPDKPGGLV